MLHGLEVYDWTLSNHESRMVLYRFTKNLEENGLINSKRFLAEAFADYGGSYEGFDDGFRKGKAGPTKLAMVARQIGHQFPERVSMLIEQLQPVWPHEKAHEYWDKFIKLNAAFSNVEVLKTDRNGLNIAAFANMEPLSDLKLELGDGFCFQLDSPFLGQAIALQCVNHAWFKLPLSRQQAVILITEGKQIIPTDQSTGKPDPYSEETNTGRHRFVFMVTDDANLTAITERLPATDPIQRKDLRQLAENFSDLKGNCAMFQVNVMLV